MTRTASSQIDEDSLSYNLQGQKLGRKGRGTRERILAAAERLLAAPPDTPMSLSAVAREASLGMTTLYLYFSDLTELLLAVLDPIYGSFERLYLADLGPRWADDALTDHCTRFVEAYHGFWEQHSRILHLRNSYADFKDPRMMAHRTRVFRPVVSLLIQQMDGDPGEIFSPTYGMAATLVTAIERLVTVSTDVDFPSVVDDPKMQVRTLLGGCARLIELGIRDRRAFAAQTAKI